MAQSMRRAVRQNRQYGLGFSLTDALNVAGSVFGDPGLGTQMGPLTGVLSSGSSVPLQARAARVSVDLVGAMAGIVDCARNILDNQTSNIPAAWKNQFDQAAAAVQQKRPDVWAAAVAAGPLMDTTDGAGMLALLVKAGIGLNVPYMGTDDGKVVNPATQQLVAQVQANALKPNAAMGTIPSGTVVAAGGNPGLSSVTQILTAKSVGGVPNWALLAGVGAFVWFLTRKR